MSDFNEQIIAEFRANGGRVGGMFEGRPLLLLHTTGRRSGKERVNPLVYVEDGGAYVVAASNGGSDQHPLWLHNVEAEPRVTVEVGERTLRAKASITADGPERDRLYRLFVALAPGFAEYEAKTTRTIPVVRLEPQE